MSAEPGSDLLVSKIERALNRVESVAAGGCLAAMLLLSLIEIGARNFLQSSLPGASVLIQYLVLWVSFLGAVLAVPGRHIKIDIAAHWISERWRSNLERPVYVFSSLVCGLLSWHAARFWQDEWQSVSAAEKWIAAMGFVFPACFLLLALHFSLRALRGKA